MGVVYRFREDVDSDMVEMVEYYLEKAKLTLQGSVFDYDALIRQLKEAYIEADIISGEDTSKIKRLRQKTAALIF